MGDILVVAGSLAQKPRHGGHAWVLLQYVLGFRRLGWDVIFVDRLEPEMCRDTGGRACGLDESLNLQAFLEIMERFELSDSYALAYDNGTRFVGRSRREIVELAKDSAFLLNVMGFFNDEEILGAAPRRVFLDIDPGFGQMWSALGLHDTFAGHDDFVTVSRIGQPDCAIPTCGLDWITTPPPVVLERWPARPVIGSAPFTSVISWRGAYGPVEYEGKTYGLRVHEFRRFLELPRITGQPFELALDIAATETPDLERLDANGWALIDPTSVAGDPWAYQAYIQRSRAEFMVAKNMYVQSRSGWFSDRSVCYLASGRPVIAQQTGLEGTYPSGEGLVTFSTVDEAAEAVKEVANDLPRHASAARALAEEYFDSDKVLTTLLTRLGRL